MRRIIWAFVIMSPLIAVAQSSPLPVLTHSGTHFVHVAHAVAATASMKVADVVHAVQALLT